MNLTRRLLRRHLLASARHDSWWRYQRHRVRRSLL